MNDLRCPGGEDDNGCPMPDFCMPVTPNCPHVSCPVKCSPGDMVCHGGQDQHGCPKPDTCMPMKGGNDSFQLSMKNVTNQFSKKTSSSQLNKFISIFYYENSDTISLIYGLSI